MDINDSTKRVLTAEKLFLEETTTKEKIASLQTLLKGINPKIDALLSEIMRTLSDFEKLQKGEIIELTAEKLPENTEEEKERKRLLLLLMRSWKQLQGEVARVKSEFEQMDGSKQQVDHSQKIQGVGRVLLGAKGPFGLVTLAAVIVVSGMLLLQNKPEVKPSVRVTNNQSEKVLSAKNKIKVIAFLGKQIPLDELEIRNGPDCDSPHYHAKNGISVTALDGTIIPDPGSCAFGKVKDVQILEVEN